MKKERKKQLKAPDEFQARTMPLFNWIQDNIAVFVAGVVVLLGVVGAIVGYEIYQSGAIEKRSNLLGDVQITFEQEQVTADEERQKVRAEITVVDAKITAAKKDKPDAKTPELDKQKEDLQAKLEAVQADHSGSLKLFQDFASAHAGTAEGHMAAVTAADILLKDDKLAEAQPLLQSVVDSQKVEPFLMAKAGLMLIGVLEDLDKVDEALAVQQKLIKGAPEALQPRLMLVEGQLQLLRNQKEDANKIFATLIEKHSESPEAAKARSLRVIYR